MITRKKIISEINDLSNLQSMVDAYEEIAATRMRRIKNSVLRNREFLSGLTDVFAKVKYSYKHEVAKLVAEKKVKSGKEAAISYDRGAVAVLLSANTGLYGAIIRNTFNAFLRYINENESDVVIVGRMGRFLLEEAGVKREVTYFDLSDSAQDPENMKKILDYLSKYETVIVFHGKFKDILNQLPTRTFVTGQELGVETIERSRLVKCIFEPTLEKILVFFETQILSALFEQTLYESALSKFTSRMISLDQASDNITDKLKKAQLDKRSLKHMEYNKKQSNTLSGISLWKR